jgi:hypothetical protein
VTKKGKKMNKQTFTANAVSDLYQAGITTDGQPFIAETFYVVIENADGNRFRHECNFNGTNPEFSEEDDNVYFPDLRAEAAAKAERLANKVNAAFASGKGIDWSFWFEVEPVYGSNAY